MRTLIFVCDSEGEAKQKSERLKLDGYTIRDDDPEKTEYVQLKTHGFSDEDSQVTSVWKEGKDLWLVYASKE